MDKFTKVLLWILVSAISALIFLKVRRLEFWFISNPLVWIGLLVIVAVFYYLITRIRHPSEEGDEDIDLTRRRSLSRQITTPTPNPSDPSFFENLLDVWMIRFLFGTLAAYVVIIMIAFVVTKPDGINWLATAFVACIFHFLASIKVVSEQERGVLILFGKILKEVNSGPRFAPFPIRLRKITKNAIQVDFGTIDEAMTDQVQRSENSDSWFVMPEPIRINWGDISTTADVTDDEKDKYKNHVYAHTLTTDPHLYFRFRVFNFTALIEEVGDIDEAIERIRDTCVTALSEMAGQTFVGRAIREIDDLSKKIFERVQDLVVDPQSNVYRQNQGRGTWGIDIQEVRIKDLGTPKRTNEAVADRAKAIALADGKATSTRLDATAERFRLVEIAQGDSEATERRAEAEKIRQTRVGEGQAAALEAVGQAAAKEGGSLVLRVQALQKGLEAGKTVILPANFGSLTDILTAATAVKEVVGGGNPSTPAPPAPPTP